MEVVNIQDLVRGLLGVRVGKVLLFFCMSELNGVTHRVPTDQGNQGIQGKF